MACYRAIPSVANTFKSIFICYSFYTDFVSTYYNDRVDVFRLIFAEYIEPYMKEIDHPALIQEWKLNLDTATYKNKLYSKEKLPSNRKEIDSPK